MDLILHSLWCVPPVVFIPLRPPSPLTKADTGVGRNAGDGGDGQHGTHKGPQFQFFVRLVRLVLVVGVAVGLAAIPKQHIPDGMVPLIGIIAGKEH